MIKFFFSLFLIAITATTTSCTGKFTISLEISSRPKLSLRITSKLSRRRRDPPKRHFGPDENENAIYGVIIDKPRRRREQGLFCSTPSDGDAEQDSDSGPVGIPAEYIDSESPPRIPPNRHRATAFMSRYSDNDNPDHGHRELRATSRDRDRDRLRSSKSSERDRRRRRRDRTNDYVNSLFFPFIQHSFYYERSHQNDSNRNTRPRTDYPRNTDVKIYL